MNDWLVSSKAVNRDVCFLAKEEIKPGFILGEKIEICFTLYLRSPLYEVILDKYYF